MYTIVIPFLVSLSNSLATRDDLPWSEVYLFVFDRLRAIRQDLVIQRASCKESVRILECAVRFHIYAGYRYVVQEINIMTVTDNAQNSMVKLSKRLTCTKSATIENS